MICMPCCVFLFVSLCVLAVQSQDICSAPASLSVVIAGPAPAPQCRYDYVVSLKHPRFDTHICSGVLVDSSWVLTLASCVDTRDLPVAYINGYYRHGPFVEDIATTQVVVHERFADASVLDPYDIALCQLATPSTQTPVTLNDSANVTSIEGDVIGWGRISPQGALSDVLQLSQGRPVVSCTDDWPEMDTGFACMTMPGCSGDAGSPVITSTGSTPVDVLIGIASQVMGDCSFDDRMAPFLEIGPLQTWISENIE